MNIYHARHILYIVAILGFITIIFLPLTSDFTINDPLLRKTLIVSPFILFIIGKFISILEKKKGNQETLRDWSVNIGLTIGMFFFLFF